MPNAKSAPVLEGFGEVEHCYKFPDKSIPTCDGADYIKNLGSYENYCYIPSLGCNQLVVMEGYSSYMVGKYGKQYDSIEVLTSEEEEQAMESLTGGYCRMVYPYVGKYVMEPASLYNGKCNWLNYEDGKRSCGFLYADCESYNCFQDKSDADDICWNYYDVSLFYDEVQEGFLLPIIFLSEIVLDEVPCELGISKLVLSTGAAFRLYAEKYTEPSLVVGYNDGKCYGKLEAGKATGTINVNYNGTVYHLVD